MLTVYSAKDYEKEAFENVFSSSHLRWITIPLSKETAAMAAGSDAICIFVNDTASEEVLEELSKRNARRIILRCAGYDNVDLKGAKKYGISVSHVPS